MAKKPAAKTQNTASADTSDESNVTRITAKDSKPAKRTKTVKAEKSVAADDDATKSKHPLTRLGGYFKGSWQELRQVRWPNRRTTWSLTLAVLAFTAFFVALVVALDAGFQLLFERLIG